MPWNIEQPEEWGVEKGKNRTNVSLKLQLPPSQWLSSVEFTLLWKMDAASDKISFWLFLNKIILIGDLSAEWITNPEKVTEKITKEACDWIIDAKDGQLPAHPLS